MNPLVYAQQQAYMGKSIPDPRGQFLGECVSWFKDYFVYSGIPYDDLYVVDGKAKNLYLSPTPTMLQHFDRYPNNPQVGDAVIYDGNFGDVALYCGNNEVVGQMDLNPSGTPNLVPMSVRPIGNYLGLLRRKGTKMDYPNEGDLTNIHNQTGWPGHPLNPNDIAEWVNGTGRPANESRNDRAVALTVEVSNYTKQNSQSSSFTPYNGPQLFIK